MRGPVPADTAFTPQFLAGGVDVVVAMYHDQGLPVIKHAGFGHAVNVTLGLPILRTSVDHGTALSLARTGKADAGSLRGGVAARDRIGSLRAMPVRKRFGQHFLHDPAVIRRIIDAVAPDARRAHGRSRPGPRRADLRPAGARAATWTSSRSTAISPRRSRRIRARRAACTCTSRTCSIPTSRSARTRDRPLRIVGNLPYNISTPVLFHLLSQRGAIADMHFMLQKEVVDRMAAAPGGKEYGRLTVMLAAYAEVEAPVRRRARRIPAAAQGLVRASCACGRAPRRASPSAATPRCARSVTAGVLPPPQDPAQRPEGPA